MEQGGRYQDLDGVDYDSVHIFEEAPDGTVLGCIRVFPKEDEPGTVQLGRLVVKPRLEGLGRRLMEAARLEALERYGAESLYLTGRKSALGFYQKCGYGIEAPGMVDGALLYYHLRRKP